MELGTRNGDKLARSLIHYKMRQNSSDKQIDEMKKVVVKWAVRLVRCNTLA